MVETRAKRVIYRIGACTQISAATNLNDRFAEIGGADALRVGVVAFGEECAIAPKSNSWPC